MKEAMYYKKLEEKKVQCILCPRECIILDGNRGNCGTRLNKDGRLFSLVYGKPCTANLDPIEKKPLFHFLPGTTAYSIATAGCNLHCKFCQNAEISQAKPEEVLSLDLPPKAVVESAISNSCKSIAYTYTDPIVLYEYTLDTAKLAKKRGLKNVIVSNGFINKEPLLEWCKYLDAANIDLKSISDDFYRKITGAWLKPVLETIKTLHEKRVWLELTNLIIPGYNDSLEEIKKLIAWVKDNVGLDVPLHFTAFYPCYKMLDVQPTPLDILVKARKLAMQAGLHYVYTGNLPDEEGLTTFCPKCKKALIKRQGFFGISENNIVKGRCKFCKEKIVGVWE